MLVNVGLAPWPEHQCRCCGWSCGTAVRLLDHECLHSFPIQGTGAEYHTVTNFTAGSTVHVCMRRNGSTRLPGQARGLCHHPQGLIAHAVVCWRLQRAHRWLRLQEKLETINAEAFAAAVEDICAVSQLGSIVVVHGAGSFGHFQVCSTWDVNPLAMQPNINVRACAGQAVQNFHRNQPCRCRARYCFDAGQCVCAQPEIGALAGVCTRTSVGASQSHRDAEMVCAGGGAVQRRSSGGGCIAVWELDNQRAKGVCGCVCVVAPRTPTGDAAHTTVLGGSRLRVRLSSIFQRCCP